MKLKKLAGYLAAFAGGSIATIAGLGKLVGFIDKHDHGILVKHIRGTLTEWLNGECAPKINYADYYYRSPKYTDYAKKDAGLEEAKLIFYRLKHNRAYKFTDEVIDEINANIERYGWISLDDVAGIAGCDDVLQGSSMRAKTEYGWRNPIESIKTLQEPVLL